MTSKLDLSTPRAKLLGVCAEVSRWSGIDPLLVRIGAIVALLWAFKLTALAYGLAALVIRLERR